MRYPLICVALLLAGTSHAATQNRPPAAQPQAPGYADLADFALASKVTAHVRIREARSLTSDLAIGTRPGYQRQLITADVLSVIRAPEGLPPQIRYLVDLPLDSRGRAPRLRRTESLIFGLPGRPGEIQLIAPNAWVGWTPDNDQAVRSILTEASSPDAPPMVRGISSAFYSVGSLPGQGETQVFLDTADNRPASLTVQREPGQTPRWFVSLGEVVDEGVSQPAVNTLLWYRLACFLPAQIPAAITQGQPEADARRVQEDYAIVLKALGTCTRTRPMLSR